jgi:multiple sugar transport system permease protein
MDARVNEALEASPKAVAYKKKSNKSQMIENIVGYIFVGPMLLGVLIINLIPIVATLFLSFTEWNFIAGFNGLSYVGLDNFRHLLEDDVFIKSLKNNLVFMFTVPISMIAALVIAILVNKHVYFKSLFKVIYFMPYISSVVAVAIVWQIIFHPSLGPLNRMLMSIGIADPPKWIADVDFALPSIMIIFIWMSIGFNMIIYMAGIQSIPPDLYEAADIDGASPWGKFLNITLPMLSPTSFFLLVTGIINTFKVFDIIQVLTEGGPANSTSVLVFHLYKTAFIYLKVGYASSIALVLLVSVILITLFQLYSQRKWVHY